MVVVAPSGKISADAHATRSAHSFGCRPLGKIPDISLNPERVELLRSQYLTNTGTSALTPATDIMSI